MAEILKEWLTERLQRPISWEAEDFGNMMRNGHVVACVLLSYHVINEEKHFLIRSSDATEDIKSNWKYLNEWLRELDVYLTDNDLENVMQGKGTFLLRLFYQLFLTLDKMDRIDFIKREKKMVSNLVTKMGQRFKVSKIEEEVEPAVENLSKPLLNERHFIEWQRKKADQVKDTFDYIRYRYSKQIQKIEEKQMQSQYKSPISEKLPDKDKIEMEHFAMKFPFKPKNYTYEELLKMEADVVERRKSLIDSAWAQDYMKNLYTKINKQSESEEFQKQMRNALSGSLWDMSVNEEEAKLDDELAKKVMKLSQFEKQMCTQIMETKQQARNLFQNRVQAQKEFAEQRDRQFTQYLDNVRDQLHLDNVEIDFEKQRQDMLHKKLYAEKMKRKRQHYYEICYETLLSIIDFATRCAYFKRIIGAEIPEHYINEWKMLFFKKQPIFEILELTEELLKEVDLEEEVEPEEEGIIRLELERQEAMDDGEFLEYHTYSGPWELNTLIPNFDPESEERKYENLGINVLGHVVYTLLEIKYPIPIRRPPADLPNFRSKALLRNLPDKIIAVPMQQLLKFRKICVVKLESAINFCLRKFKSEMVGCTDIELSFDKFITAAQEEPEKELIKMMKTEDDAFNKNNDTPPATTGSVLPNCKQTQTPKTIPEEDIKLSEAADLGRYTYEALSSGESLTDYLLAAMLVEYIKGQDDIQGFVIINYPNCYREAQILEETFSGLAPPDEENFEDRDDIYLEETIAKHRKKEKDPYKEIRLSELLKDPHKKRIDKPFESYFTCYINLKETVDILKELVIWELTEENSELIDRFYAILGMNYSMYYETIEKELLGQLCKYIIGDCDMPHKSLDELFGENVYSKLDFISGEERRAKAKLVKPEVGNGKSRDTLRAAGSKSKFSYSSVIIRGKEPSAIENLPEDHSMVRDEIQAEDTKSIETFDGTKILPGEEDWDYGELPFAHTIGVALATCWEQVEKMYIHDMKHLFFAIRMQMNCLVPYFRFIKDKMEQIITLPSHKQDLVSTFQKEYNDFENDWRDIDLTKNEWHCRVKELQQNLYKICDERKFHAEQQRQALITENWAMEELTTMVNSYISCMQTELNRSMLTFQALHDFYYAQIKKMPPNDRLSCKDLVKVFHESDESSGSKRGGEDKLFRHLRSAFQDLLLKNIQIDYSNNPLNIVIENNVKLATKVIKETNDSYRSIISREYAELSKLSPLSKKREDGTSEESICSEEMFKQQGVKCVEEWTMGINGEMFRATLRIHALQYKSYRDMKLFNDNIFRLFMEVRQDINTYYLNEIKSVDRLCKYLQLAVESGRRITESLILEHDTFVIDPNLLQFPPPPPPPGPPKVDDYVTGMDFKISQLARLRTQFKIVAPTGIALQQAFIYLMQDFIFFGKETCEGSLVPDALLRVNPEQISKLVSLLFGESPYIDWRDFLIYSLNIRFPTVEELLQVRHAFRCIDVESTELISRDDFIAEQLWYEEDFDPLDQCAQLRKNLIKHFLFELYETSQDMMNYSAFLLAFCKSPDPIEGFASALSIAIGKKTCFSTDECEEVVCNLIKQKKYRDESMACALKCTNKFLDKVIDSVVNTCEGTTVIEMKYTPPVVEQKDKKGKKGKMPPSAMKAKKTADSGSQSTRVPKQQKSLQGTENKTSQSATEVKTTFICPPCSEYSKELTEDKTQEKEVVEEEQKSLSPREDLSLAYTVSQDVIWNILKICLPWHFEDCGCWRQPPERFTPYICQLEAVLKRLEVETFNGDVYVCRFVSDPGMCKLLNKVKKFTALNLAEEVRKIML